MKRKTLPDDEERFIENFYTTIGNKVKSREEFNRAYKEYTEGQETNFTRRIKSKVYDRIQSMNKFQDATQEKPRLKQKGKQTPRTRKYSHIGITKQGQTVFAEQAVFKIRNKVTLRLRDSQGRFVKEYNKPKVKQHDRNMEENKP